MSRIALVSSCMTAHDLIMSQIGVLSEESSVTFEEQKY